MALLRTDPLFLKMNADGDLDMTRGLVLVNNEDLEAVKIGMDVALNMIRGEWRFNLDEGFPWFEHEAGGVAAEQAIIGQRFNAQRMRAEVTKAVLKVPGVSAVMSLLVEFDRTTREVTVNGTVSTIFGVDVEIDEVF